MMIEMTHDSYGKSDVRLMKVTRGPERHHVIEVSVDIRLEGDFEAGYTDGDNTKVLPTDTMKNTVYALARRHPVETPEQFALLLAEHFVDSQPQIARALVSVAERPWNNLEIDGRAHPHAFSQATGERRTAVVDHRPESTQVRGGLRDLVILKSANSGFSNFVEDEFTTLAETDDRVLATSLEASWRYDSTDRDFAAVHGEARTILLKVFAAHESLSVQHTLHAMGERVLQEITGLTTIHLQMPNKHNLPVDLEPFGMDNPHQILLPIDEPSGFIEATLKKG